MSVAVPSVGPRNITGHSARRQMEAIGADSRGENRRNISRLQNKGWDGERGV